MATLVKLNSTASASLVKVYGVAMAGISKILSQTYTGGAPSPYEDLTTYTEVDEDSDLTVTSPKADVDTMRRDALSYVVYDFGAAYFGDFEIQFEYEVTASANKGLAIACGVSNTLGGWKDHDTANDGLVLHLYGNISNFISSGNDFTNNNTDGYIDGGTTTAKHYATFKRVFTTATVELYSDSGRTSLVDTISLTCGTRTYRYLYATASANSVFDVTETITYYTQNFEIVDPNSTQDLTTYTEVDSASEITVTTDKCDVVAMRRDSVSYVYKDFGAAFFGDFDIDFEVEVTAGDTEGNVIVFALSNTVGTLQDMHVANDCLEVACYNNNSNLRYSIIDRNTDNSDVYYDGGDTSALMYCTLTRVTNTLTLILYSDAARTSVVDTMSLTCETGTKRYLYASASRDIGTVPADTITLYTQNIKIITAS